MIGLSKKIQREIFIFVHYLTFFFNFYTTWREFLGMKNFSIEFLIDYDKLWISQTIYWIIIKYNFTHHKLEKSYHHVTRKFMLMNMKKVDNPKEWKKYIRQLYIKGFIEVSIFPMKLNSELYNHPISSCLKHINSAWTSVFIYLKLFSFGISRKGWKI